MHYEELDAQSQRQLRFYSSPAGGHFTHTYTMAEVYEAIELPRHDRRKRFLPDMVYFMQYCLQTGEIRGQWPVDEAIQEALACGYVVNRIGLFYAGPRIRHGSGLLDWQEAEWQKIEQERLAAQKT